ncbi:DUF962 domain-containing protein [Thalassotalea piscium]
MSKLNSENKMKTIAEQLSTYKSVHLNKNNVKTHFVGVPLIIWSVALLLTSFSFEISFNSQSYHFTLTAVLAAVILMYYLMLSLPLALVALPLIGGLVYSAIILMDVEYKVWIAIGVFVIGWGIQFIGHAYEKAKPAFLDDLNQLAIGPLFLIAEVYFYFGFDQTLNDEVTKKAIAKRKAFNKLT